MAELSRRLTQKRFAQGHAGNHVRKRPPEKEPPPDRAPLAAGVGQGLFQEPSQPGQFQDRQGEHKQQAPQANPAGWRRPRGGIATLGRACRRGHSVGPMVHGANSSSPTSCCSLLVVVPLATSRTSSTRRRPTLSTGSPSRMVVAFISISSLIRSYIGVLVASLMQGVGLRPSTLPRPVVKTRTLAPLATRPVVQGGS